ncbi:MAG: HAD-IIA family hydrolase [Chloroflexi bacterium]|nr:MAG: HAD-IIA family hydrolase [Chloroflexota bacterium]
MLRGSREAEARLAQVRCFLLDMDGTLYLGRRLLPGARRFLQVLQQQGKTFLVLTNNSSQDSAAYAEKLARLGLPIAPDRILTSGEATALYLWRHHPGARLFVVGTPALEATFTAYGFALTDQDPDLVVVGFDTTLTYAKLWRLCDFVRAGLPYIATHPDLNCPTETGYMPDIGAIIAFVRASTGREPDRIIGKPHPEMVEAVLVRTGLTPADLCMVGDRLYTDIALGSRAGILTVLVLTGEARLEDLPHTPYRPDLVLPDLDALAHLLEQQMEQRKPPSGR